MQYPTLKTIIKPNITMIGLLLTIYLANWILLLLFNPMWLMISIFLITLFNVLLIIQINSKYSIIRIKTFLPVFFFTLFISVWTETHLLWSSHLALTAFLFSLMLFLGMYRNNKAVEPAFLGTLLISITGLINPAYLFLIPISWIGFVMLRSFSTKVFLASVTGLLVPWIFYFSYQLWTGDEIHLFDNLYFNFQLNSLFTGKAIHHQVYIASIVILMIVSLFRIYTNLLNDTVQTRKNIHVLLLYLIFLVVIVVSFAQSLFAFLPFIAFCLAMLFSHPFTLNKSKFYPTLFIFFVLINCAYVILNYLIF